MHWRVITIVLLLCSVTTFAQIVIERRNNDDDDARREARRQAIAAAKADIDKAQTSIRAASERVRKTWKANPELLSAEEELKVATEKFEAAQKPVIDELKQSPEYRAALDAEAKAAADVRREQAETNATQPSTTRPASGTPANLSDREADAAAINPPDPSDEQIQAAADRLNQKTALRALEAKAIAADPASRDARQALDKAQQRVRDLQKQLDAVLVNDPDYRAAQQQLADARSRLR